MCEEVNKEEETNEVEDGCENIDAINDAIEEADDEIEEVEEEVDPMTALQNENDELNERILRISADYQNYVRRSEENSKRNIAFAKGNVLLAIVPLLDQFDIALQIKPQSEDGQSIHNGVELVKQEFVKALQAEGVAIIEPTVGEAFEPGPHEAVMQQPAEGVASQQISMVLSPGYQLGDRVLRAAKVAVAP